MIMVTSKAVMDYRITSIPQNSFSACVALPFRETELTQEAMGNISGKLGLLGTIVAGVAIYAITHPKETVANIDWAIDQVSQLVVAGQYYGQTLDSMAYYHHQMQQ
jgi:hypothetical protein